LYFTAAPSRAWPGYGAAGLTEGCGSLRKTPKKNKKNKKIKKIKKTKKKMNNLMNNH
jgi:hypothetical protein